MHSSARVNIDIFHIARDTTSNNTDHKPVNGLMIMYLEETASVYIKIIIAQY
jgi:hypothetical protein